MALSPVAGAGSGGPDGFGYTWIDSNAAAGPDFEWIDISSTGTSVISGVETGATIDRGAPLSIYGKPFESFAVSRHGYVSSNDTDTGTDSTNDCNLPQNPSPAPWQGDRPNRIYVTHDDLNFGPGGEVLHQYFPTSPHPQNSCGVHVITWKNMRNATSPPGTSFSMQVLMFNNFDVLMQFQGGLGSGSNDGASSTTGIQQDTLAAGLQVACDTPGAIPGNHAILFTPPVIEVTTSDDQDSDPPGPEMSLREALREVPAGTRIEIAPSLAGETFLLDRELVVEDPLFNPAFVFTLSIDAGGGDPIALISPISSVGSGNNAILRADVTRSLMHFCNIEFINLDSANIAPAIDLDGPVTVVAERCGFENHRNRAIGGSRSISNIHLYGCWFEGNQTTAGVTDPEDLGGGAIATTRDVFASHCEFAFNRTERPEGITLPSLPVGGAISCRNAGLEHCIFRSNLSAASGAAIWGGLLEVADCEFDSNTATRAPGTLDPLLEGGAIRANGVDAIRCLFRSNTVVNGDGGAIFSRNVEAIECQFEGNRAPSIDGEGGAITGTFTMDVQSSFFENNGAGLRGGAIAYKGGSNTGTITNCALGENSAPEGGGVYISSSNFFIRHSTFVANTGGAVSAVNNALFGHSAFERNTDDSGSPLSVTAANITDQGFNVLDDAPSGFDDPATRTNSSAQLALFPYYVPRAGSPLIEGGDPDYETDPGNGAPEFDIRGIPRVEDGDGNGAAIIDIGCYEVIGSVVVTTAVDETADPGTGVSLREALAVVFAGGRVTFDPSLDGAVIDANSTHTIPSGAEVSAEDLPNGITIDATGMTTGMRMLPDSTVIGVNVRDSDSVGVNAGTGTLLADCGISGCRIGLLVAGDPVNGGGSFRGEELRIFENGGNGVTAVEVRDEVVAVFDGCDFFDNSSLNVDGGAIRAGVGGVLQLNSCQVLRNIAESGDGGGVVAGPASSVILRTTTVARNESGGDGGGVACEGQLQILGSTLSMNSASGGGGAMHVGSSGLAIVEDSTVVQNHADGNVGGISTPALALARSIVAANTEGGTGEIDNFSSGLASDGGNLYDLAGEISASPDDLAGFKPLLGPLSHYGHADGRKMLVHAPLAISPVIDAVADGVQGGSGKDQRGFARVADGRPGGNARQDIGAVEAQAPIVVNTALDQPGDASQVSLREAVGMAEDGGRVIFGSSVNGQTINLRASEGGQGSALVVPSSLQIDATTLPHGVTVNGGRQLRGFIANPGVQLAMHAVSITEGRRGGSGASGRGSAINALAGSCVCFTHGCIYDNENANSSGTVALADASLHLFNSTIVDNFARTGGGAIALVGDSSARIEHSSVVHNRAGASNAAGLGMGTSAVVAFASIIGDNTNGNGTRNFNTSDGNVSFATQFTSLGYNLTNNINGALVDTGFNGPGDLRRADILVQATAMDLGGWSRVAPFQGASPAIDAGPAPPPLLPVFDQRGFARAVVKLIDIGPFELDGDVHDRDGDGIPDWWEDLWGFNPLDDDDADEDPDMDGDDNETEFQNGTNPRESAPAAGPFDVVINHVSLSESGQELVIEYTSGSAITADAQVGDLSDPWDLLLPAVQLQAGTHTINVWVGGVPQDGDLFFRFAER